MAADRRWNGFVCEMMEMDIVLRRELRIMRPTAFSPLQ
jgi:hypothetical protein